ncbi:MAG: hydroxymethylglutaryl-CoA synthase [Candidatus Helarchaeota archaeon]
MKIGLNIVSYGSYIPRYRIKKEEYIKSWGNFQGKILEKAVIGYDEDTLTMAAEASLNALRNSTLNQNDIGLISIGTSTPPYSIRSLASEIRMVLGLSKNVILLDFKESEKAGSTALNASLDMISKRMKAGLVIASDSPRAKPNDELDHTYGAGAAAFIVGNIKGIATIDAITSASIDFIADRFKREGTKYVSDLSIAGYHRHAYQTTITNAMKELFDENGYKMDDFKWILIQGHDTREILRASKLIDKNKVSSENLNLIGDTGAASIFLELINVLETKAQSGDQILCIAYGAGVGADAFSVTVNDKLEKDEESISYSTYLKNKAYIDYGQYLKFKEMIDLE